MNKKMTLLKPLTAAVLLAVSFTIVESCRKPDIMASDIPHPPSVASWSGTNLLETGSIGILRVLTLADVTDNNRIRKISPAGVVSTIAGNGTAGFRKGWDLLHSLTGQQIVISPSGGLYVTDYYNNRIRKIQ